MILSAKEDVKMEDVQHHFMENRGYLSAFSALEGKGNWEKIFETLIDDPDYEWHMMDAIHCKVHPLAAEVRGGNQDIGNTKEAAIPEFTLPWTRLVYPLIKICQICYLKRYLRWEKRQHDF